ncbi:MAG: helix-turn-helix domain-containing protein [Chitinophagaceae bacterium]|nr:helix-turn-helix domain-containing protein [Chitinophagaceae bacterium]
MIKNQKQASITRQKLRELKKAKQEFEKSASDKDSAKFLLGLNSFDALIKDLENEISLYEFLTKGNLNCLQAKSLNEIPEVLIATRLAQKISQKQLGEMVGLKEQQIQRYESTDYETASWPRIIEISTALKLNLKFEKIVILNESCDDEFEYPQGVSVEQVEAATKQFRQNGSLIF